MSSHLNYSDDDYEDEDDLIAFQFRSNTININYSKLAKYSKYIRNKYLVYDIQENLPKDLYELQEKEDLNTEYIISFFDLLQNNFDLDESQILVYKQYTDLVKIAHFFEIKKLSKKLVKYFKIHKIDPNFIIDVLQSEIERTDDNRYTISKDIEDVLTTRINECLQNEKFANLQIPIIYRIVEKSAKNEEFKSDDLYDFVMRSIERFNILFCFVDIFKLSPSKLDDLLSTYSELHATNSEYFYYLKVDLNGVIEMRRSIESLKEKISSIEQSNVQLQVRLDSTEQEKSKLQSKLDEVEAEKSRIQKKLDSSECEREKVEKRLDDCEQKASQLQDRIKELQSKLSDSEKEKDQLQKELDDIKKCKVKGTIVARVNQSMIEAEINLQENGSKLDTQRSKWMVSASNAKSLGPDAYRSGEPVTSLSQRVECFEKPGTYFVRAVIFDAEGRAREIVSNAVETRCASLEFSYEGRAREVTLPAGRYVLEVWGASGGKSTGTGWRSERGRGGLGGYSKGTIALQRATRVFVVVGGKGESANSADGAETGGGFPDGGGTKTGHFSKYSTVPGTGGGSTSIRVSNDSLNARVIVAGGGGGAGGDNQSTDHGGFGGGTTGGNSYCEGRLRDQGAGTQTGSTPGPAGSGPAGVAGTFGQGATGLYCSECDSGGGGGGGWYGGGSGGYGGSTNCASGGGGSGWVFTRDSYQAWKSGAPSDASKFELDPSLYLESASTTPGSGSFPTPQGSGRENGHEGHGYAKITPV